MLEFLAATWLIWLSLWIVMDIAAFVLFFKIKPLIGIIVGFSAVIPAIMSIVGIITSLVLLFL
jgi:hypothetical protein